MGLITVCICTYNRADTLTVVLQSLAAQRDLHCLCEVLVVDNNSSDKTRELALSFGDVLPLRLLEEKRQGLSHARNRAVAEFRGDVLLFTDDDVRLASEWLSAYAAAIEEYAWAGFYGGRILPDWTGNRPSWLRSPCLPLLDGVLVWYDLGEVTRPYAPEESPPIGASFAVRRSLLDSAGEFRVDLGRAGTAMGRGEETEFLHRAMRSGARGVYVGKALCWHRVDPRRLSLASLYRYGIESGRAHRLMAGGDNSGALHRVPVHLGRGLAQLLKGRGDRFRQCVINAGIEVGLRRASPASAHKVES